MSSAENSPQNSDDDSSRLKWSFNSSTSPATLASTSPQSVPPPPPPSSSSTSTPASCIINPIAKHKSAFLPYRPPTTVLTNLQRGNTEATFFPIEISLGFHERAGQGELTEEQVLAEVDRRRRIAANSAAAAGGAASIDFVDKYGFTPLHWACYYGQLATAIVLIDVGADVNREAPEMVTPLILAACGGHHEIVRILLQRGAIANHMDIVGNTALMYAAAGNHPHTCNELLSSKDPDLTTTNEFGDTAYSLAISNRANLSQAVIEHYISALLSF